MSHSDDYTKLREIIIKEMKKVNSLLSDAPSR